MQVVTRNTMNEMMDNGQKFVNIPHIAFVKLPSVVCSVCIIFFLIMLIRRCKKNRKN